MEAPDRIHLTGLTVSCVIGIFDWEREKKQRVVIDLSYPCDNRRAARTDRIEDAQDYKRVAKATLAFVAKSRFGLVETLAESLAAHLLGTQGLGEVTLRVSKPGAVRYSSNVGVEITRRRPTGLAFFSLGSNLDPSPHLSAALAAFRERFTGIQASAPYVTSPVGTLRQPDFWNLVVGAEVPPAVPPLRRWMASLERRQGRVRGRDKNGPRTLDVDLLVGPPGCGVPPHPDIERKAFVLFPFLEIAPGWTHPTSGLTLVEMAARFRDRTQKIKRLPPGLLGEY